MYRTSGQRGGCCSLRFVSGDVTTVLQDALNLPDADRATVAAELLASLPAPVGSDAIASEEWLNELEQRARDALTGIVTLEDWDAVEKRILDKLPGG